MMKRVIVPFLLLLLMLVSVSRADPHTFTFEASTFDGQVHQVHLAGSFNGWSRDATPMHSNDTTWTVTIDLPEGVHHYKFVVNGDRWVNDPKADKEHEESDGHGGVNSGVFIGVDGRKLPQPRPHHILTEAVRHDPRHDVRIVAEDYALIRIMVRSDDVERIVLYYASVQPNQSHPPTRSLPMRRIGSKLGFDVYAVLIERWKPPFHLSYHFGLTDGSLTQPMWDEGQPFTYRGDEPGFETPEWAKHAVWYQIFPERFRNGDSANDPEKTLRWTSDWWATHDDHGEAPGAHNFYRGKGNVWWRKYGGDIQGLTEALPYLRTLGVNAIYLNPMFEADSQHKYDTADFRHIDDNFGFAGELTELAASGVETDDPATWTWTKTDLLFLRFVAEAHRQGFRVIIDGVFNHVGRLHFAFQDVLKHGRDSHYADWFEITDWGAPENWGNPETHGKPDGIQWRAWDGDNGWLPVFKKNGERGLADGPREHIMAITRRWMDPQNLPGELAVDTMADYRIDGWRLDVPGDIPHPFWVEWRQLVKRINPDAYITGEIWGWAQPWLKGDQFDAVMNYQFAMPAQQFFVNQREAITPTQFAQRLHAVAYNYPLQVSLVNQNLFDSHDTDRLASMFVNPDRPYDGANRLQDNGPDYDPRRPNATERRRMLQAVALQMTFLGAPMIYYGNEAGMWSPDDPSNRQPMVWPDLTFDDPQVAFDADIFASYRRAIAARQSLSALRLGLYRPVTNDDDAGVFAFARDLQEQSVYVVVNRSDATRSVVIPIDRDAPRRWCDALSPEVTQVDEKEARPRLTLKADAPDVSRNAGGLVVQLPPWGTSVLVDREVLSR